VKGDNGAFEVSCDGRQVFSKLREGRFPAHQEISKLLKEQSA
jgi:selT/selW/selH-like putative selenoprotein